MKLHLPKGLQAALLGVMLCGAAYADSITVDGKQYDDVTIVTGTLSEAPATQYILIGGTTHVDNNVADYKIQPPNTAGWATSLTEEQTIIVAPATVVGEGETASYAGYQTFFDSGSQAAFTIKANIIAGGKDDTNLLRFWGGNSATLAGNLTLVGNGVNIWNQNGTHNITGKLIATEGQTLTQVAASGGTLNLSQADFSEFAGSIQVNGGSVTLNSSIGIRYGSGSTLKFKDGALDAEHSTLNVSATWASSVTVAGDGRYNAVKNGNQLELRSGSEAELASITTTGSNGGWLVLHTVGNTTTGQYTDITLNSTNNGLILGDGNATSHIGALAGSSTTATVQGDWGSGGNRELVVHQDTDTVFAGIFKQCSDNPSGTVRDVALTKKGSGTLELSGANTSRKTLTVSEGGVKLTGSWAGGISVAEGASLAVSGGSKTLGTVNINGQMEVNDSATVSSLSAGSNASIVIKEGNTLDASTQGFNHDTHRAIIAAASGDGTLKLNLGEGLDELIIHSDTAPVTVNTNLVYSGTGTLALVGTERSDVDLFTITQGKSLVMGEGTLWAKRSTVDVYGSVEAAKVSLGHEQQGPYTGVLKIEDGGSVKAGQVTFENKGGSSSIQMLGGTLEFTQNTESAIAKNATDSSYSVSISGGTLKAESSSWHVDAGVDMTLTNTVAVDTAEDKVISIASVIAGTGCLTKTGDGEFVLSGANTYTGGTSINGGSVTVKHDQALGTGAVTLAGGTLNVGSGYSIANTVNMSEGTLTVGGTIARVNAAGGKVDIAEGGDVTNIDISGNAEVSGTTDATKLGIAAGKTATMDQGISVSGVTFSKGEGAADVTVQNTAQAGDPIHYSLGETSAKVTADSLTSSRNGDVTVDNKLVVNSIENTGEGTLEITQKVEGLTTLAATVGDVTLKGADAQMTLATLSIGENNAVSVFTGADAQTQPTESTVTVTGNLTSAAGSDLYANLVIGADSVVTLSDTLTLHSDVGVAGKFTLAGDLATDLQNLTEGEQVTLIQGANLTYSGILANGQDASVILKGVTAGDYSVVADGNVLAIKKTGDAPTPEPTTGTLSLLALAGLMARRRRK